MMENKSDYDVLLIDNQGLSHYTCYFAKGLSKYRKIMLLGFSAEDYYDTFANEENNIIFKNIGNELPKGKSMLNVLVRKPIVLLKSMFKLVLFGNYKIIHIQGHLPLFFLFVPILKLKNKKIFWTLHDVNLRPSSKGIRGKIEIIYVKLVTQQGILLCFSNKIIVHGNNLKNILIHSGVNKNKIETMPHFDYQYLQNKYPYKEKALDEKDQYILFFGNIKPYKGIEVLINAIDIVINTNKNRQVKVLIAGKGDLSPYTHLLAKQSLRNIQIRNEKIPSEEIPKLFINASMVIMPYNDASQSGVIPLSYTFSKPVIVSNIGSLAEYVDHGKTGFIFNKGDSKELAKFIITLICDRSLRLKMGDMANKKLISEMSLDVCCKLMENMYCE